MKELLARISRAEDCEIDHILDVVLDRYRELLPTHEMWFVQIEKDKDRNKQLDHMIQVLERAKTSSK